ncbi:hypothetical protein TrCOL_g974 [Triparma columacea]|uniref:RRM domain-containing protein n=1 Tax=Triparma columacea TaxID=722753 RepID=A0A9W7L3M2_9STRA|nr:hypothetical protein TrCOL_g974 [Triparma columacea]
MSNLDDDNPDDLYSDDLYSEDLYSDIQLSAVPVSSKALESQDSEGSGMGSGGVEFLQGPEEDKKGGDKKEKTEEEKLMAALGTIQATVNEMTAVDYSKVMDDPPRWEDNPKYSTIQYRDSVNRETTRVIASRSLPSAEIRTVRMTKIPPNYTTEALLRQYFRCLHMTVQAIHVSPTAKRAFVQVGTKDQALDLIKENIFCRDDLEVVLHDENMKPELPLERRPVRQSAEDRAKEIKAISLRHGDELDPAMALAQVESKEAYNAANGGDRIYRIHRVSAEVYRHKYGPSMASGRGAPPKRRKLGYVKPQMELDIGFPPPEDEGSPRSTGGGRGRGGGRGGDWSVVYKKMLALLPESETEKRRENMAKFRDATKRLLEVKKEILKAKLEKAEKDLTVDEDMTGEGGVDVEEKVEEKVEEGERDEKYEEKFEQNEEEEAEEGGALFEETDEPSLLVQVTVPLRMWISEDDIVDHLAIFGDNEAVSAPKFVGEYVTIRVEFEEVEDCKMAVEKGKNYQGEKDAIKLRFIKLVE